MKKSILLAVITVICHFSFAQIPVISSFAPISGSIGTPVIISGTNFSATAANNTVYFGAVKAVVQSASTTSLTVTVPVGATFQPLSIAVNNFIAYSARPFIVTNTGGGMSFTATSFAPPVNLPGDAYVTAADIDGDQRTDLIYAGAATNKITIHRNTTTGGVLSFTSTDIGGFTVPISIKAGDINGDGLLDLVVSCPSQFRLYVLKNTSTPGNISFSSPLSLNTVTEPRKIAIGDLDNDGKADIACTLASTVGIAVFRNISAGGNISFAAKVEFTVTSSSEGIAIGDLTQDGKPDIITAVGSASGISVLENTSTPGTISFSPRVHFFTDGSPWEVAIADIDGDGKADMLSSNTTSNNITIYRNTGSNPLTFATKINLPTSTDPRGMELIDLNTDGKPDIVLSNSSSDSAICVLKNTSTPGNIAFEPFVKYGPNPGLGAVALADLDNDGLTDITIGKLQSSALSIFKNQLNINTPVPQCPTKPLLSQINDTTFCASGSVNLVSSLNSNNQWFKNNTIINGATGISYSATTSGDYFVRVMNTSSGCYNYSDTVSISVLAAPATPVITVTGNLTFCHGDSVKLQSPAATGYQWFNGGIPINGATNQQYITKTTGTYTVKTTNATNCMSAASTGIVVTTFVLPAKPIITSSGISVSTTAGFISYLWYRNNVLITGATANQYNTTQNGIYKVTVGDINGCKNTSDDFNFITTGINDVYFPGYTIQLYPNPVINELHVKVEQTLSGNGNVSMVIIDGAGKHIQLQTLKQGSNILYFKNLPPGVYMVLLKNGRSEKTIKILKL